MGVRGYNIKEDMNGRFFILQYNGNIGDIVGTYR